jgi:thioredoxin 1
MATRPVSLADFEATVLQNPFVVLDFWAAWCGPCRAFGPVFERASNAHPDVVFGKIDTEAEQELAGGLGITSIPTLMIFRDGIRIYSQPGALPDAAFNDLLARAREVDMDDVRKQIAAHQAQ